MYESNWDNDKRDKVSIMYQHRLGASSTNTIWALIALMFSLFFILGSKHDVAFLTSLIWFWIMEGMTNNMMRLDNARQHEKVNKICGAHLQLHVKEVIIKWVKGNRLIPKHSDTYKSWLVKVRSGQNELSIKWTVFSSRVLV